MKNFNPTMTIEEAKQLFTFKGETMFPDTNHNRKMMAVVVGEKLKSLQSAKN